MSIGSYAPFEVDFELWAGEKCNEFEVRYMGSCCLCIQSTCLQGTLDMGCMLFVHTIPLSTRNPGYGVHAVCAYNPPVYKEPWIFMINIIRPYMDQFAPCYFTYMCLHDIVRTYIHLHASGFLPGL